MGERGYRLSRLDVGPLLYLLSYLSEKGGGDSVQTFAEKIIMNPSLSAGGPPAGGTIVLANGPICTGVTTMNAIAGSDPGNALGQGTV